MNELIGRNDERNSPSSTAYVMMKGIVEAESDDENERRTTESITRISFLPVV